MRLTSKSLACSCGREGSSTLSSATKGGCARAAACVRSAWRRVDVKTAGQCAADANERTPLALIRRC